MVEQPADSVRDWPCWTLSEKMVNGQQFPAPAQSQAGMGKFMCPGNQTCFDK